LLILPEYAKRPRAWQKRHMIFVVVVDNISIGPVSVHVKAQVLTRTANPNNTPCQGFSAVMVHSSRLYDSSVSFSMMHAQSLLYVDYNCLD